MIIETRNLVKAYRGRCVVDSVDIKVGQGQVVGLLGPNGAGKTTTFYMIVGLEYPDEGQILVGGQDITSQPMYERSRYGIGYLPQEASIFRKLTVEENILAILELQPLTEIGRASCREELMEEFNVTHVRKHYGSMLSGGERRRVEIARAIATNPAFILLDEPFAGVDPISVGDIQEVIAHLKRCGIGVLITDHNVRETLTITNYAYILHQGKVLVSGNSAEIADSEIARKFYLGEKFAM